MFSLINSTISARSGNWRLRLSLYRDLQQSWTGAQAWDWRWWCSQVPTSNLCQRGWGSEGPGECNISLSLPHSSATGSSECVSYSVEQFYVASVINCLYQPGRAEGGRGIAYPYVNQLYRNRLDVVLAGHVTSVARIGRCYEFWLTFTLHANHAMLLEGIVPVLSPGIGQGIRRYQ